MKTFLAGPWIGEFGWEVATWIPAIRKKSRKYDKTICVGPEGHQYLYADFCDEYVPYNVTGVGDRWLCNKRMPVITEVIKRNFPFHKIWEPNEIICTKKPREYKRYGELDLTIGKDIVIHARSCPPKYKGADNWPVKNYEKLWELLKPYYDCAYSIGTKKHAYHVEGTIDMRGVDLKTTCNVMYNSRVVVGPSSGPMHLAHICNASIVVWTYDKWLKSINGNNRKRYKKLWRANDSTVVVIDKYGWQPSPEVVAKAVLEEIP